MVCRKTPNDQVKPGAVAPRLEPPVRLAEDATGEDVKTREEVAAFIEQQLLWERDTSRSKESAHHYGRQELRDLLDFIYGAPPVNDGQGISAPRVGTWKHGGK